MFFSDPVAAFANIRASLKPDARLAFVRDHAPGQIFECGRPPPPASLKDGISEAR